MKTKTVNDVIKEVSGNNKNHICIAWGRTRTILNALDREAVGYIIGYRSLLVMFRKRGGFLAYRGYLENGYHPYIRVTPILIKDATKDIIECERTGRGISFLDKKTHQEIAIEAL